MARTVRRILAGGEVRQLSKHCDERLLGFPLPDPFTLDGLIANIERDRACSIRLMPLGSIATDLRTACGLRVRAGSVNIIAYRPRPSPNQTLHTICHELAHLWLDHGNDGPVSDGPGVPKLLRAFLAEHLGADIAVHARAHYASREEREAELTASLIRHRIRQQASHGADLLSAMEASLIHPLAPPRPSRLS
ncbi:ImmA/IrrE family metallo-endopeptidase [Streptomyces noboritoensis]|uniref:ImmA/IrrE family metallo-endopeptidase n=1 Tax=Streptomyces noboritoensis TaxID=67337 RepID=UPI00373FDE25